MPRAKRKTYPKHAVTYEVREAALEVGATLAAKLHALLDALCELREVLRLERAQDRERARAVRAAGGKPTYLTKGDQYRTLSALAAKDSRYGGIHSQVLQDVADRIELATKAWLRQQRGPVKFLPRKRYRSFTFTQYGSAAKLRQGRLHMSKLGDARVLGLRKLPGRLKKVTVVFKQGRWFAQFTCEVQVQHCERQKRHASAAVQALPDTGLDTGLARVATLADGSFFLPGNPLKSALPKLRREQKRMSRKFEARQRLFKAYRQAFVALGLQGPLPERNHLPLSHRLQRQLRRVAICHTKVERTRRDDLRKAVRRIEQQYRLVGVEEHSTEFMRRNRRTSRAVSDVAPGLFKQLLKHTLGPDRYIGVGTSRPGIGGNSQTCLCGALVPKTLKDRWHECPACGLSADRDEVSANIVMRMAVGYSNLEAQSPPEPGQGFVRRGEGERPAGQPVRDSLATATEPPVKRPSSRGRRPVRNTTGAKATVRANNPQLFDGASALSLSG